MKVLPSPTTPIPTRTAAPAGRAPPAESFPAESFPATLRGARAVRERETEPLRPSRSAEAESRPAGAPDEDESSRAESTETIDERAETATEDRAARADAPRTGGVADDAQPVAADGDGAGISPTLRYGGDALLAFAPEALLATDPLATADAAASALAAPLAVAPSAGSGDPAAPTNALLADSSTKTLPESRAAQPAGGEMLPTTGKTPAPAAAPAERVSTDPKAAAAMPAEVARAARDAMKNTAGGAAANAGVAGSAGAEGETAPAPARDAALAPAPAGNSAPGWFDRPEGADRGATDRATFHLLAAAADAEPGADPRAPEPAPAPSRAATGRAAAGSVPAAGIEAGGEALAPASSAAPRADAGSAAASAAPAAEAGIADPGEPAELARRIYRLVRRTLARGEHELRIRLDPPRLGRVDVEMSVDERRLGIRFTVESEEVRDTLKSHLTELHRSLGEHGFSAESVEVDLRDEGNGADRPTTARSRAPGGGGEEGDDPAPAEIRLRHLGRTVDLRG